MSYDIYIGQAIIEDISDEYSNEYTVRYRVKGNSVAEAPEFRGDNMTGKGNSRHPGYSQWSDFCNRHNLYNFFFDKEEGLMREHPGCFKLTEYHTTIVRATLEKYQAILPTGTIPGTCMCEQCASKNWCKNDELPHQDNLNYDLARLMWLDFWFRWALDNCKMPAIFNS